VSAPDLRTLIVDDDVRVADVHRGYVERVPGFAVCGVAHRGADALLRLGRDDPDLVLLDMYLPDIGGLDVCRRLRAAGSRVDVIAVTAAHDIDTVRGAVGLGVTQYLVKPFTFAAFRDKLDRYAAFRRRADRGGEAGGQAEIDALLAVLRGSTAAPLPKGLSAETLELIARTLRAADGELGATEAAERAGISRVTARRYLEHLVDEGRAELALRYGGTGRPEHRYRWAG
jgi:response regulator of citrate/malate metabolism